MTVLRRFRWKKGRRYPVKRDEEGKSARTRCFEMFEDDVPAPEVAKAVGVKIETVYKYHQQWKTKPKLEQQHAYFKRLLRKTAPDRERTIELIARTCGIDREELEAILQKPHGLRSMMTGKLYFPTQAEADHKRYVALELALFISDHLTKNGGKLEDVSYAFERWTKWYQTRREEEDQDVEEDNKDIAFIRQVLHADMENERQGRVQPERLSAQERNSVLRWGAEKAMRDMEKAYWSRIGELMAGGITMEQAREKVYQDLVDKGDIKGAKMVRGYQDFVHPSKADAKPPQRSPHQHPPSRKNE